MSKKRYYITTPIYYVNSVPHIGTALTTLASDVTARYQKMRGREVTFLTGTDENGLKVAEAAAKAGKDTQAFVDEISEEFRRIWKGMHIEYDDFIRTTEPRHIRAAQEVFKRLQEKGHITKGKYEGWYDVSTETFYKESELVDGKSPEGNEVRWVEEENYFFRLSHFEDQLKKHIEKNPKFIIPEVRRNEVLGFIKQGLRDASISRSNPGWGIPVPGDDSKVIYVWFEALVNYIAATGWPDPGWEDKWPADVEWMGKDILTRFHATLWPAMLMGLDLPLPETLVGHGWMLMGTEKMAKSKGNVVRPLELAEDLAAKAKCTQLVAVDAVRYYMAATMPYENDSTFTMDDFERKYNSDLANDLGNALNRSLAMAHKFVQGVLPKGKIEGQVSKAVKKAKEDFEKAMEAFRIDDAAEAVWVLIRFLNKYIDERAPWSLAKNEDKALGDVLRSMIFCLRSVEGLVRPIMPKTADAIATQLHLPASTSWDAIGNEDTCKSGVQLQHPQPIFPRLELEKPVQQPKEKPQDKKPMNEKPVAAPANSNGENNNGNMISIEDFAKVQFRVGRILEAEPVEGADKLLKLQVVVGDEKRQIVAGIRNNYQPADIVGMQVVVVFNLKPAKLRGVESQGMLLAATDENGGAILLQPEKEAPEGTVVR